MNLQELEDYFKTAVANHKELQGFTWYSLQELSDKIHQDLPFPCLGLEEPLDNAGGQSYVNRRWFQNGAFMVFLTVDDAGDHTQIREVKDQSKKIALDVVAKMVKDRRRWDLGMKDFVLPGLDHDSFTFEFMPEVLHGFIVGGRVTFRINNPAQHFDLNQWNNEPDYEI